MRTIGIFASVMAAGCGLAIGGCRSAPEQAAPSQPALASMPASAPADESEAFTASRGKFSTMLPRGWKTVEKGGDYVLALVPQNATGGDEDAILSVQYPNLPPHIPGMLPIGGVADGYVNDLKKRFPDEKVDSREDLKLDNANGRHIVSSFTQDGKPFRETAMLTVHGDHVYVITATCPAAMFEQSQTAFTQLTSNWKWN